MAYVFNPITGKLDDAGTPTTDASLLTSGKLADARLSSNVSLDNINNNFSASQTFAGSANTAPNQTAASRSSLMTRSLVARESIFDAPKTITPVSLATVGSSGGSTNTTNAELRIDSGTSTTVDTFGRAVFSMPVVNTEQLGQSVSFVANLTLRRQNGLRMIFGGGSSPNADIPAARCWGVDFTGAATGDDTAVRAQLWYNDSATVSAPTYFSSPVATGTNYGYTSSFIFYYGQNSSAAGGSRSFALFFSDRSTSRTSTTPLILWNHNILIAPSSSNVSFVSFAKANVYPISSSSRLYGQVVGQYSENLLLP
jgi:hypothetical protein